jgi:hypothetical protein
LPEQQARGGLDLVLDGGALPGDRGGHLVYDGAVSRVMAIGEVALRVLEIRDDQANNVTCLIIAVLP